MAIITDEQTDLLNFVYLSISTDINIKLFIHCTQLTDMGCSLESDKIVAFIFDNQENLCLK